MVEKRKLLFEAQQCYRTIRIYLPPSYQISQERYPVIYMFDGQYLFDDVKTSEHVMCLDNFLDKYDQSFIVIGIDSPDESSCRLAEYCPYDVEKSHYQMIHGYGQALMEFIVHTVKPYIDTHYRTLSLREYTMIGGFSMGGLMALYAAISYHTYFSKAACLSSSIGICLEALKDEINQHDSLKDTCLFLSWGSEESRNKRALAYASMNQLDISHLLNLKGVQTYPYLLVNGRHHMISWQVQIPLFMDYLWKSK